MKTLLLCLTLILLTLPLPAHAQEEPTCEPDYTTATELWETAQAALTDADLTTALDTFRELRHELARVESECLGLNFTGEKDGEVTDIMVIPEGLYKVTVTSTGYLSLQSTPITGECGEGRARDSAGYVVIFGEGEATEGFEALFYSDGCEVMFTSSNVTAPYTVVWEKIK